ncbi:SRPBCC family protein [Antrihabitans cavernicola]|uniref:ATPase n=1 Tax=Antrihabitans cavernicola TaxID=2495913 RepID=A0A5A7S7Q9_9NOCA|nr:SRPBCC family protein [Spelaeibacter cavernicola]KAA0018933.1 ATPase [Spelaeibacter cavernicola]
MTHTQAEPIQQTIVVNAPLERAFSVFVDRFDAIKPREHNLLAVPIAETVFEPRVGGNIYDRGVDGTECRWARVLAYEPPNRLVFSWDIDMRWQIETDPNKTSEVEVRFIAQSADSTRVELEHRNLERHGDGWEAVRDGVDNEAGWPLYLQRYADQVNEPGDPARQ